VYAVENSLCAVPFDPDKLAVTGGQVPMVQGVFRESGALQYAISNAGTLAYIPESTGTSAGNQRTLVWVDQKGQESPLTAVPRDYVGPRISPDGTKVALAIYAGGKKDIWILDLVRENMTLLTLNGMSEYPLWTPDGKRIAYTSTREVALGSIYWKPADGTGFDERLGSAPTGQISYLPFSWSGDGKILVTLGYAAIGAEDIGALSMEGERKWRPLLNEKHSESVPEVSHDGRWLAYHSNESGEREVYVRPFPDVNKGKMKVSVRGGTCPLWSPDGRKLYYRSGDAVMAVSVETESALKFGKPEILFRGPYTPSSGREGHPWDISPDGKRFLMMKESGATTAAEMGPRRINIVLNWFEELKQRLPVK
jgi:serine/threonine-protein kinase